LLSENGRAQEEEIEMSTTETEARKNLIKESMPDIYPEEEEE
jgi:hypothetical protein